MLLDLHTLLKKYKLQPKGVIHVGAHFCEEYNDYLVCGIQDFVMIEPCKKAFEELRRRFEHQPRVKLFNMAMGDHSEIGVKMYTSDNAVNKGQSNSLLKPSKHLQIHPEIVFADEELVGRELVDMGTLDSLMLSFTTYDLLVMDCQGYEGRVLKGGKEMLARMNAVYTEVNCSDTYEDNTLIGEMDELLSDFKRVETSRWVGGCWADAFFVRKSLL